MHGVNCGGDKNFQSSIGRVQAFVGILLSGIKETSSNAKQPQIAVKSLTLVPFNLTKQFVGHFSTNVFRILKVHDDLPNTLHKWRAFIQGRMPSAFKKPVDCTQRVSRPVRQLLFQQIVDYRGHVATRVANETCHAPSACASDVGIVVA
ncbi:hypothetical protein DF034_33195 [Burkholderia anthina]|nr:hypothetical protein DF034_33195 [Burkholderia anthina]